MNTRNVTNKKVRTTQKQTNLLARSNLLGTMFAKGGVPTGNMLPRWDAVVDFAAEVKGSFVSSIELFDKLVDVLRSSCPEKRRDLVALTIAAQSDAINTLVQEYDDCVKRIPDKSGPVLSDDMVEYFEIGDNFTVLATRIAGQLIPNNHTLSIVVQEVHDILKTSGEEEGAALLLDVINAKNAFKVTDDMKVQIAAQREQFAMQPADKVFADAAAASAELAG